MTSNNLLNLITFLINNFKNKVNNFNFFFFYKFSSINFKKLILEK